jgi:hypothetical protein
MHGRIDVLGPACPDSCDHLLGTVFIVRHCQLSGLTHSADQLLEWLVLRFRPARFRLALLMTRAQDRHSWVFKIGSNGPLVEAQEGDEGGAILSSTMVASLYESWTLSPTERGREGRHQNSKAGSLDKLQSWPVLGARERRQGFYSCGLDHLKAGRRDGSWGTSGGLIGG